MWNQHACLRGWRYTQKVGTSWQQHMEKSPKDLITNGFWIFHLRAGLEHQDATKGGGSTFLQNTLIQRWPGLISRVMASGSHRLPAEEAFTELWIELQRSFGFQITLPRPLPEVQDAGAPACTHLSELGWKSVHFPGPMDTDGTERESRISGQDNSQLSLSSKSKIYLWFWRFPKWIPPFLFIYLLI